MGMLRVTTLWLAISFIQACSSSPDEVSGKPAASTPAAGASHQKTVFDPLTSTLDRARSVQGTIDDSAERTRKAADQEERGDSAP